MVEKSKEEDQIKNIISTKGKMGSFLFMRNSLLNSQQTEEADIKNESTK